MLVGALVAIDADHGSNVPLDQLLQNLAYHLRDKVLRSFSDTKAEGAVSVLCMLRLVKAVFKPGKRAGLSCQELEQEALVSTENFQHSRGYDLQKPGV